MDFIELNILDFLDVFLVTILLFQLYQLVRGTVAIKIFIGITSIYLFWKIVGVLQMELLSEILGQFIGVGVIAFLIVFQQEIRRFLLMIGSTTFQDQHNYFRKYLFNDNKNSLDYNLLVESCYSMSSSKTGALIIISRNIRLGTYENTGEKINAKLTKGILESIFFKNSPLHDGAVIINQDIIASTRCILPISEGIDIPIHLGLRHRAAASITEMTDAIAIVVSEETGNISYLKQGRLNEGLSAEELGDLLIRDLGKFRG